MTQVRPERASERIAMMILMVSGIAGGLITSFAASPWLGVVGAVAVAPFGGSLAALAAAFVVAARRAEAEQDAEPVLLMTADEQVKALREMAARSRLSPSGQALADRTRSGRAA